MKPKLVITDIDGVWTDGGMYYNESNIELKKFNTYDSAGVVFLHLLNIPIAVLTGENTPIIERRATKLKVKHVYLGVKNKLKTASELCKQLNISLNDVAFIGNDINDIPLLREVGLSAVPADAPEYVANQVTWVMNKDGGDGVFREFVERILIENNLLQTALQLYEEKISGN